MTGVTGQLEVGKRWRGVTPCVVLDLDYGKLILSQGSVVAFEGDAIVNAANQGCLGGGGVDGAITSAGGDELALAREALPVEGGHIRCRTGGAVLTGPAKDGTFGRLHVPYVVHAVGPNYNTCRDEAEGDELLRSAYASAMSVAAKAGIATIGFSLLSAGIFRGRRSLKEVLGIGMRTIKDSAYQGLEEVHLVAFTGEEISTLDSLAQEIFKTAA